MKASATNSLTSGPHTEIDDISYRNVVAAESERKRASRAGFGASPKTNFGPNRDVILPHYKPLMMHSDAVKCYDALNARRDAQCLNIPAALVDHKPLTIDELTGR